ncbi:hypothetical protein [Pseudomonas panipatensis]|jgi:hypothetical protein|uniref:Uncharacterized protein n=1 Tax=Pseudomonas panipatensis TaxID=428992 RepID=A0A1G8FSA0_9PSED|nr:hypothetical protein [Pseudomonas panipatensis]SDH84990.1 hypothetical protein SAMN05216272_103424 [Pseudomonas panipatensis]SMP52420.1 hypothetical protein SAMN06295951_10335 [Pseudomonas panipatensis]
MHMQLLCAADGCCYVQLDQYRVPFRDERQAREYLSKLRERLAAPHSLPYSARRAVGAH